MISKLVVLLLILSICGMIEGRDQQRHDDLFLEPRLGLDDDGFYGDVVEDPLPYDNSTTLQNNCNCNCNCNPTVTCAPPVNTTDTPNDASSAMTSYLLQLVQDQQRHIRSLLSLQEAYNEAILSSTITAQPQDCQQLQQYGTKGSGSYAIYPDDNLGPVQVYCDNGGWTVIQRREDGSVNFNRGLDDYREGFGNVNSEHWLGLHTMHRLSAQAQYELRIELQDWDDNVATATYDRFRVGDLGTNFKLILGRYDGNAGDGFSKTKQMFHTLDDMENLQDCGEGTPGNQGGWWGRDLCSGTNLNGIYYDIGTDSDSTDGTPYNGDGTDGTPYNGGVVWKEWKGSNYSLKRSEMKIRAVK